MNRGPCAPTPSPFPQSWELSRSTANPPHAIGGRCLRWFDNLSTDRPQTAVDKFISEPPGLPLWLACPAPQPPKRGTIARVNRKRRNRNTKETPPTRRHGRSPAQNETVFPPSNRNISSHPGRGDFHRQGSETLFRLWFRNLFCSLFSSSSINIHRNAVSISAAQILIPIPTTAAVTKFSSYLPGPSMKEHYNPQYERAAHPTSCSVYTTHTS